MIRKLAHISVVTVLAVTFATGMFLVATGTVQQALEYEPQLSVQSGVMGLLTAQSAYVFDVETGEQIYAKDADAMRPVASVTKLLSSAMFYEHASQTEMVRIAYSDILTEGRSGRLQAGQQYIARELLVPALLESSNDASVAMYRLSGNTLVAHMNDYVQSLSLSQTRFSDTSGLSSANVSSARELATLSVFLRKDYPHIFDYTQLKTYLNHINAWMNNSPYIHEDGYKGGKHGYTPKAGRTAVAFFEEKLPSGTERVIGYVLLDSDVLKDDMQSLRTYVQQNVDYK